MCPHLLWAEKATPMYAHYVLMSFCLVKKLFIYLFFLQIFACWNALQPVSFVSSFGWMEQESWGCQLGDQVLPHIVLPRLCCVEKTKVSVIFIERCEAWTRFSWRMRSWKPQSWSLTLSLGSGWNAVNLWGEDGPALFWSCRSEQDPPFLSSYWIEHNVLLVPSRHFS